MSRGGEWWSINGQVIEGADVDKTTGFGAHSGNAASPGLRRGKFNIQLAKIIRTEAFSGLSLIGSDATDFGTNQAAQAWAAVWCRTGGAAASVVQGVLWGVRVCFVSGAAGADSAGFLS